MRGLIACRLGRIINIASDGPGVGSTGEAGYSGCKAAVIGFSKVLAREVARNGITVNLVCPGPTETDLLASVMAGKGGQRILAVAAAVAFFVSDGAGSLTGQVLSVSGGLAMVGDRNAVLRDLGPTEAPFG